MVKLPRVRAALVAASLLSAGACQKADDEDAAVAYRAAVPTREAVTVQVPGATGAALTVEKAQQPLVATESEFYRVTRDVSRVVNGGVVAALALVKAVTNYPATSVTADTAVWGPWSEALAKNAWKVTVTRTAPNQYSYKFEGKPKAAPDSAFVTVMSGVHTPTLDAFNHVVEGFGAGTLHFDWDAASTLPEHDDNVGKADVTYAHPGVGQTTTVSAQFRRVMDREKMRLIDVDYAYTRQPNDGGQLEFTWQGTTPGMTADDAKMAVESRWLPSGAGRADVKVLVPNATAPATLSDCWDPAFASVFRVASWDAAAGYGAETACAFTPAEYTALPL